ncbi:MAG: aminotransferase, partial [Treponemataceae bacterium]|nr:aminotransferase [Treponemataceae bacterium]
LIPESLFAYVCDLHENVAAVKIDGPTKEDYVWGFRCGFITFGGKGISEEQYEALVKKLMGVIRSSVSCSNTPAQSIMLKAFQSPSLAEDKKKYRDILEGRYRKARAYVDSRKGDTVLIPQPFNSGYFMSFTCVGIDAEELRLKLLYEYEIGTIAIDAKHLRIAFSSLDKRDIDAVYEAVYNAAHDLAKK